MSSYDQTQLQKGSTPTIITDTKTDSVCFIKTESVLISFKLVYLLITNITILQMILLAPPYFQKLSDALHEVTFNCLFARAVIDHQVSGTVYVDNPVKPRSFYIVHRYGMSLLGGDCSNSEFNSVFREYALNSNRGRTEHEWMQVFPGTWNEVLKELFADTLIKAEDNKASLSQSSIELNTRVNFLFDRNKFLQSTASKQQNAKIRIVDSTKDIYNKMIGSVVPKAFWDSSKDFEDNGISYSLYYEGKLVATAFSSFLGPGKLELGIETVSDFRGQGLAEAVCAKLIEYCIESDLEPIWSCRLENTASYTLARKLGFTPTLELPYYRLSN